MVNAPLTGNDKNGFTLVELMVAQVIMMIVVLVTVSLSSKVFQANTQSIQMIALTQELRSSMQLILRDVRRSGYNDDALAGFLSNEAIESGVTMGGVDAENRSNCLQVRYEDLDGADRNVVYRLRIISTVGRVSAHFGADASCDTALDDNGWIDVSNPLLTDITAVEFIYETQLTDIAENLNSGNTIQLGVEQVSITIGANLKADPAVSRSIVSRVQIRNNYLTV